MKRLSKLDQISRFVFEIGSLRKIARSHRQALLTDDLSDNIATHSFRVAWLGYFLAILEKVDPGKVVLMCLLHDLPESRSGDQNWIHKRYVKVFETEIREEQFRLLPGGESLLELASEYDKRLTKDSKLAKDADILDQLLLLKEYALAGNQEAPTWLSKKKVDLLSSQSAKRLAVRIMTMNPHDWWRDIWTDQRR